jgi:hypothetical protein
MGINTPKKNRIDQNVADQLLIDGINKNAPTIQSIAIGGVSETTKDIVATLQSRIDSANAVSSSRATWQAAVQADRANHDKTRAYVSGLRQALLVAFAGKVDTLAQFGLTGRKTPVVSPDELVARTAQALATRKARHTMGKKQKAEIKGTVAPAAPAIEAPPAPTPIPTPPAAPAPAPVSPATVQTAPTASPAPAPVSPAPAQAAAPSSPVPSVTPASTTPPAIPVAPTTPTHGA